MNAQTPRMAAATAYLKTGDLEAAYLAGYAAEGRLGMGVAPTFKDGPTAGHRALKRRQNGVFQRIMQAVQEGHTTARAIGEKIGTGANYTTVYLRKLEAQGRLERVGTVKVKGATAIVWAAKEASA